MALTYRQKEDKRRELQQKISEAQASITVAESLADELGESFSFLDKTYTPKVGGGWDLPEINWDASGTGC